MAFNHNELNRFFTLFIVIFIICIIYTIACIYNQDTNGIIVGGVFSIMTNNNLHLLYLIKGDE